MPEESLLQEVSSTFFSSVGFLQGGGGGAVILCSVLCNICCQSSLSSHSFLLQSRSSCRATLSFSESLSWWITWVVWLSLCLWIDEPAVVLADSLEYSFSSGNPFDTEFPFSAVTELDSGLDDWVPWLFAFLSCVSDPESDIFGSSLLLKFRLVSAPDRNRENDYQLSIN